LGGAICPHVVSRAEADAGHSLPVCPSPPWRQPRGKSIVSWINSHKNATRIGLQLWEIDLRFAPGLLAGAGHSLPVCPSSALLIERLVIYCQTTSVSAAHATHCATHCTPCRPLIRAFSGWIRTPPPKEGLHRGGGYGAGSRCCQPPAPTPNAGEPHAGGGAFRRRERVDGWRAPRCGVSPNLLNSQPLGPRLG
jgi:hypothetical protein